MRRTDTDTDTDTLRVNHPSGLWTLTMVSLQGVATPGTRFNAYPVASSQ